MEFSSFLVREHYGPNGKGNSILILRKEEKERRKFIDLEGADTHEHSQREL
jgi:hypothetical protein